MKSSHLIESRIMIPNTQCLVYLTNLTLQQAPFLSTPLE
jgi:hypothetical protein